MIEVPNDLDKIDFGELLTNLKPSQVSRSGFFCLQNKIDWGLSPARIKITESGSGK